MSVLGIVIGLAVVGGLLYWLISSNLTEKSEAIVIVKSSQPGNVRTSFNQKLPASFNEPQGAVFSYTGWLLVNDFASGYGERRMIFSKGDMPGLYLDSTSNSLVFVVNTYGAKETVLIPNIPANKWLHIGLVVDQTAMQIYINGRLRQYHTLAQLADPNDELVKMGGGWDGVLGGLAYYPRALSNQEIDEMAQKPTPNDLRPKSSAPQYFDMTWYTGRLNSS
jgi:hypothetical protein